MKKILYMDMDGVLVDFQSGIDKLDKGITIRYEKNHDEIPGIFALMEPMEGALEAYQWLTEHFDTYILSTAPWNNPSAWQDKLEWVKRYLGKPAYKRLILTHHKELNSGSFLIDDRSENGAEHFKGKFIKFRTKEFPDWSSVIEYLKLRT